MRSTVLLTVLTCILAGTDGARILVMQPFFGKSHRIFTTAVLKSLIQRGHHVVEYSPFRSFEPSDHYTHVEIHSSLESMADTWTYENFTQMTKSSKYSIGGFIPIWLITYKICEETFQHDSVKKLLNSKEHFDLIITDSSFGQESMVVFGHKFNAPTVTVQGFSTWCAINMDAGNSLSIATIPDFSSVVESDNMSFLDRLVNLVSTGFHLIAYYNYHLPSQDKLIKTYYRNDAPSLEAMVNNISLYLVNSNPATEYTRPYSPNIVPVGGITVSLDRTILPEDIKQFMDEAPHGVIYFSLGTVVPAHTLPQEVLQVFVNVFRRLEQRVIWKINLDNIENLPANVLITKWVPQPGVLAHSNCILFITHGGQFSQQEALYAGVPVVGIPFFGDQPFNVRFSEHRGYGIKLDFRTISEETLYQTLTTAVNDPKYKKNAQRWSAVFRDRPMTADESVVFWVEYVMRHGGAHHLRPAAALLPWYSLSLLDVLAALMLLPLALYFAVRALLTLACNGKKQIPAKKKNN